MIINVCSEAVDKVACLNQALLASQNYTDYNIKILALGIFSLVGLVGYLALKGYRQPDTHIHKKEIYRVPEPTWKKITDAGLSGLAFGICAYAATGTMNFTMKIVYSIFSKNQTDRQQV